LGRQLTAFVPDIGFYRESLDVMATAMQTSCPPSRDSRFVIGRDSRGRWVVCDRRGLVGGLFTDRDSAVHFAVFESDHAPGAVCCVPDGAILSLGQEFETGALPDLRRTALQAPVPLRAGPAVSPVR
jgi:hypothetical protein